MDIPIVVEIAAGVKSEIVVPSVYQSNRLVYVDESREDTATDPIVEYNTANSCRFRILEIVIVASIILHPVSSYYTSLHCTCHLHFQGISGIPPGNSENKLLFCFERVACSWRFSTVLVNFLLLIIDLFFI